MPNSGGLKDRKAIRSAIKVQAQNRRNERDHIANPCMFTKPKKVPRSKRVALNKASKNVGFGMPAINDQRRAEKAKMVALGLKTRKQLRKFNKKQKRNIV